MKKRNQFTLVEILIVIGIIVVLAGMILAGLNKAMARGDIGKAKADMSELSNAISAFELEYNRLPKPKGYSGDALTGAEYKWLLMTLQGQTIQDTDTDIKDFGKKANPKKKKFLSVQGGKVGEFVDPWGNRYQIVLEKNYDKGIDKSKIAGMSSSGTIHQPVIIWSDGEDDSKKSDNVYSVNTNWTGSVHEVTP